MADLFTSAGVVPVTLEGLLSNLVASAPRMPIGDRPLAMDVPIGTRFIGRDSNYVGISGAHPKLRNQRIWYTTFNLRTDATATASAAGATTSRLGVYNPTTRVFTQATVAGQFCNARAGATVGGLATMSCAIALGLVFATVGGSDIAGGVEVMTDASGFWVPYVDNGVNIPLGICPGAIGAGSTRTMLQYDW